ncbi:hypothetical protein L575_3384 [Bordetella pertussis STO1-SEAT-0007]|nr:hypothetical protein L575_3384 [Bordetella pertussis STO1-SEAT-0007]
MKPRRRSDAALAGTGTSRQGPRSGGSACRMARSIRSASATASSCRHAVL